MCRVGLRGALVQTLLNSRSSISCSCHLYHESNALFLHHSLSKKILINNVKETLTLTHSKTLPGSSQGPLCVLCWRKSVFFPSSKNNFQETAKYIICLTSKHYLFHVHTMFRFWKLLRGFHSLVSIIRPFVCRSEIKSLTFVSFCCVCCLQIKINFHYNLLSH